ncbi:krev interaction trapped protein 1 isoform X1 [Lethenteron reissneri]|uniref:krev interaction trapped protein 1 isoform X1 n=2 Tax=Lethenteron reissneri TaxID=7753 RepID=UPI002AB70496|nr:krev interaction trapped protein 1 isoform X1 [Lethenteron reissneri]XP_061411350.1 krev interaction trapped protein 1 isoform X1 [Lethenteron reissneri]XP_061411351.1 krev interaction trapped protein 1 isoform X1 [Lethenteron reissneri]
MAGCDEAERLYAAVIRPKKITSPASMEYHPKSYEILLCEKEIQNDAQEKKRRKVLLGTTFPGDGEAGRTILEYVFEMTKQMSPINQGLRGKRSVLIKRFGADESGVDHEVELYIVPTTIKDNARLAYSPSSPGFYCLQDILRVCGETGAQFSPLTSTMLLALDRWLGEQHTVPLAIVGLFRPSASERIKMAVVSPAYRDTEGDVEGEVGRECTPRKGPACSALEARARMLELEKPEICIVNPLFGSDLQYTSRVDKVVVNPYFGLGVPDYSRICVTRPCLWRSSVGSDMGSDGKAAGAGAAAAIQEPHWMEEFPLHRSACEGDRVRLTSLLEAGQPVHQLDHDQWAPIHYACWYGQVEATQVLLEQGRCDPNLPTGQGSTALHFSAGGGHTAIVSLLLNHREIDRFVEDQQGRSPVQVCEENRQGDWEGVVRLLRDSVNKTFEKVRVYRVDGSYRAVELPRGNNTTVQQVIDALRLPAPALECTTIWICSPNLTLQLKPFHKPLQHVRDWAEIVAELTSVPPQEEDPPRLMLRRDVRLSLEAEAQVSEPAALGVLFEEARVQLLEGMYPCTGVEATRLAALLLLIHYGLYDAKKHKQGFLTEENLNLFVSSNKLKNKAHNWIHRILHEYKHLSRASSGEESPAELQRRFLQACWAFPTYGSAFFQGHIYTKAGTAGHKALPVIVGVSCRGVQLLNADTKALLLSVCYAKMTWDRAVGEACLHIHKLDDRINYAVYTKQVSLIIKLMAKLSSQQEPKTPTPSEGGSERL